MRQEVFNSFSPVGFPGVVSATPLNAEALLAQLTQLLSQHLEAESATAPNAAPEHSTASLPLSRDARTVSIPLDHWAAQAYAERRLRDKVFNDPEIFGEPAWDALLDIAAAEAKGERLAVTSACIGSCAPSTTALRWLKTLEERQFVRREADPRDARRSFVTLTDEGRSKVRLYFQEVSRLRSSETLKG